MTQRNSYCYFYKDIIYKKQLSISSPFSPRGCPVCRVWTQNASLCSRNLSLSPPRLNGLTSSVPWNLSEHTSCPEALKCLATKDFSSWFLMLLFMLRDASLWLPFGFAYITKAIGAFEKLNYKLCIARNFTIHWKFAAKLWVYKRITFDQGIAVCSLQSPTLWLHISSVI